MGTSLWDQSTTAGSNTTVGGISIAELCPASNINDGMRAMIAQSVGSVLGVAGAGTNTITCTVAPAPAALTTGMRVLFKAAGANTTAATLQVNSLTAKNLYKPGATGPTPLIGGEIQTGQYVEAVYDGTQWVAVSQTAPPLPAGVMTPYGGSSTPTGWLACDGSAVSRTTYAALFTAISTTWGVGDGSTTFNVPNMLGRVAVGAGSAGSYAQTVGAAAVTTATDKITITANDEIRTGTVLVYTTSGTQIAGLTAGNTYYAIFDTSTTIKLASSLANAVAGTAIDLTTQGTGNHTFTKNLTARTLAATGGEETHALTTAELPAHTHPLPDTMVGISAVTGNQTNRGGANPQDFYQNTLSAGGSTAHNVMQPYAGVNWIIKI